MTKRTLVVNIDIPEIYLNELKALTPDWNVVSKNHENIEDKLKEAEIILHWNKCNRAHYCRAK